MEPCKGETYIRLKERIEVITDAKSQPCIFRVHEQLRKVNERAYEPQILAIGPYHRHRESLQWMEKQKWRYLHSLLHWKKVSLDKFVGAIMERERELRGYYAEPIDLDHVKFTEMIILDGSFIVQLLRKFNMPELREQNDPIFKMDWVLSSLQRDMILFENQLPFPALRQLFDMIEGPNPHDRFIDFFIGFLSDVFPGLEHGQMINEISPKNIKHLPELVHKMWAPRPTEAACLGWGDSSKIKGKTRYLSATKLKDNGVKFRTTEVKRKIFEVEFRRGVLWIPPVTIEDTTESFFCNLMAYEQYSKDLPQYFVTNYIKFLNDLVDSPRDVQVLRQNGVIDNLLGDSDDVYHTLKRIINKSTSGHNYTKSNYYEVFDRVNAHYSNRLRQRIAEVLCFAGCSQ